MIATAILSAASMSAFAQTATIDTSIVSAARRVHHAPAPVLGAGLPALAAGGIGYGIFWLVRRRRRAD